MAIPLTTSVAYPIAAIAEISKYPSHLERMGQGGFRSVPTLADRDAILVERRAEGMLVYVTAEDKIYQLTGTTYVPADVAEEEHARWTGGTWAELELGGAGATPSDAVPLMDGTADAGTGTLFSRDDHVHPSDTAKADASALTAHTGDTLAHIQASERAAWDAKQDALLSGTNIRTVNGESLLSPMTNLVISPASNAFPAMNGTAAPGSATDVSRSDHVHPVDTSRQETLISGANIRTVNGQSLLGSTDLVITPPTPSDVNPEMDGTAAPGSAATFARADHVHPHDTSRLPFAGGTLTGFLTLHSAPTANMHAVTKLYVDEFGPTIAMFNDLLARVDALEAGPGPSSWDGGTSIWDGGATTWDP